MKTVHHILLGALLTISLFLLSHPGHAETGKPGNASTNELFIGGVGGVYFLAEPGELTVEVVKRDRNRHNTHAEQFWSDQIGGCCRRQQFQMTGDHKEAVLGRCNNADCRRRWNAKAFMR